MVMKIPCIGFGGSGRLGFQLCFFLSLFIYIYIILFNFEIFEGSGVPRSATPPSSHPSTRSSVMGTKRAGVGDAAGSA